MSADLSSLIDVEVGPAKEPPTFPAVAFHSIHILVLIGLVAASICVEKRMGQPWPYKLFRLHHLVILSQYPILYGLDLALRRLGYKSRLKAPTTQSTREVWSDVAPLPRPLPAPPTREVWARVDSGHISGPKGEPAGGSDGSGAIVLRTDLQFLAGLGVPCLAGALMFGVAIVMAHANSPQGWPGGIGWGYGLGAALAILGCADLWCGLGTRWETRFDDAGITRVRFDRVRFTPWSAIGGVTIRRTAASAPGAGMALSFRDREGRRLWGFPIDPRRSAEAEHVVRLMRAHLPDLQPDPLAEEVG